MAGLNNGFNYTLQSRRNKNMMEGRSITTNRPCKVFNAETKEPIKKYEAMATASRELNIPQETIRNYCKKNRNKDIEDCVPYLNYIFQYGEEPVF